MINVEYRAAEKDDKRSPTFGFTEDQKKAYETLLDFINKPYDEHDYKRALAGPAGTGKTYLVKALLRNCSMSYSLIGLAAPTHKAGRVLRENISDIPCKVNTIHSDFGFRPNYNLDNFDPSNPPFDPRAKVKIGNYHLYIIDESSMITSKLLGYIENICKKFKCKIIYIGDDDQLAPVGDRCSGAFVNIKISRLTEIVRQEEDNPVTPIIKMLRYDVEHKTNTFLQYISKHKQSFDENYTKGYIVCDNDEFKQYVYNNFSDEQITRNVDFARIICFKNITVGYWNKFVRNSIIKDADKSIITKNDLLFSYTTIVNVFNEDVIRNSEEYIVRDIVNYVHPRYKFKGFMVTFAAIHGGKQTRPLFIIDHTDKFTITAYLKIRDEKLKAAQSAHSNSRAAKWKDYFDFTESCLLAVNIALPNNTLLYGRDIDYGFAITSHKSQGSTYDTALVDIDDIVFDKNGSPYSNIEQVNRRLYVAVSRCKNKCIMKFSV